MSANGEDRQAEARHWLLKFSSGDSGSADKIEFLSWLKSSPENQLAFDELQQLWGEMEQVSDQVLDSYGDIPAVKRPARFWAIAASFVVSALILGLLWQWQGVGSPTDASSSPVQYSSRIGELKSIVLADGTRIELGAYSRLKVRYTTAQRLVTVERGEAYFDVAPNRSRPFVVASQGGTATAVGTAFAVHKGVDWVRVTVAEGKVAVSGLHQVAGQGSELLVAGDRVAYNQVGSLTPIESVVLDQIGNWRQGRRVFSNAPLAQLIEDLNRYSDKPIIIADTRLSKLEVSGAFDDFADTMAVLQAVEQSLAAEVVERNGAIYLLHQ